LSGIPDVESAGFRYYDMDLRKLIQELSKERVLIDRAIAELEKLQNPHAAREFAAAKKHRGRKGIDEEERRQVSE
jgi:hypothetical protein